MSDAMFDAMLSGLDFFSTSPSFKTKRQESMATNHSPIDEFFGTIDDEEREGEATVPYSGLSGEVVAFISFFPFTC